MDGDVRRIPEVWSGALDDVDAAFDGLLTVTDEVDGLGIPQLHAVLERVQGQLSRSQAIRSRLTAALQRLEQAKAAPGKHGAGEQEATRFLKEKLQLSPGEAKRTASTGRRLADAAQARAAFERGAVSEAHAAVIARRLGELPEHLRGELETALVERAARLHPAALDKEAQRLIGELDVLSLETAAKREKVRTSASWRRDDDGALVGSFRLYGVQAESMEVALHAATSRRAPGDDRSDEHRRAEALVRLADTTLRAGTLPSKHGIRPHVIVLVRAEDLARRFGVATLGSGATVPLTEAGALLADCVLTRIVLDARGVPLEGSVGTRTVPAALYKALLARDGGCSWEGCDVRAGWCQVAHGHTPHGAGGALTLDNAALLCERHHQQFDAGGWAMLVDGATVTYERDPSRPPVWSIVAAHRRRAGDAAPAAGANGTADPDTGRGTSAGASPGSTGAPAVGRGTSSASPGVARDGPPAGRGSPVPAPGSRDDVADAGSVAEPGHVAGSLQLSLATAPIRGAPP